MKKLGCHFCNYCQVGVFSVKEKPKIRSDKSIDFILNYWFSAFKGAGLYLVAGSATLHYAWADAPAACRIHAAHCAVTESALRYAVSYTSQRLRADGDISGASCPRTPGRSSASFWHIRAI